MLNPNNAQKQIVIDAREFDSPRMTGIGRFLSGLLQACLECREPWRLLLAVTTEEFVPLKILEHSRVALNRLPSYYLRAEKHLSTLTKQCDLYLSPYPKLPLFGTSSRCINTIHDVLDLTHSIYKSRFRKIFDKVRLRQSLQKADRSWYDSKVSLSETINLMGHAGRNPAVRWIGIEQGFSSVAAEIDDFVLQKHGLDRGYILNVGNGLPHKNLGLLLSIEPRLKRKMVFVGVSAERRRYWLKKYPNKSVIWLENVGNFELPSLYRNAHCLAHPSHAEGFGYPPIEAMACGIPCVVNDIPILRETTGESCLILPARAPELWLEGIHALEKEALYRRLRAKGLKWSKQFQGLTPWAGHLEDIRELLE